MLDQDYQLEETDEGYRLSWDEEDPDDLREWLEEQGYQEDPAEHEGGEEYVIAVDDDKTAEVYIEEDQAVMNLYPQEEKSERELEFTAVGIVNHQPSLDLQDWLQGEGLDLDYLDEHSPGYDLKGHIDDWE